MTEAGCYQSCVKGNTAGGQFQAFAWVTGTGYQCYCQNAASTGYQSWLSLGTGVGNLVGSCATYASHCKFNISNDVYSTSQYWPKCCCLVILYFIFIFQFFKFSVGNYSCQTVTFSSSNGCMGMSKIMG